MLVTLLLACLLVAVGGSSWPAVDPDFRWTHDGDSHTAVCRFDLALADCRLRVWGSDNIDTTLGFQLGAGSAVKNVTDTIGRVRATASYAGAGLHSGECGVHLAGVHGGGYLVQCAGKLAANGSWATGYTLLQSTYGHLLAASSSTPRYILAAAGSDVSVQLDAGRGGMDSCYIDTPAAGLQYVEPGESLLPNNRYRVHEAGMQLNQCYWTLTNVQPADAGLWKWWGERGNALSIQLTVVAVVAAPRGRPEVRVRDAGTLSAGDVVEATCSAPAAVPPSELTWLLDGVVIRKDTANDTLEDDEATWTFPWEPRPARQTLRRLLTSADLGKTLECRAQHVAKVDARTHSVELGVATAASIPLRVCSALTSLSVAASCILAGIKVNCQGPVPVGVTVQLSCRPGYRLPVPAPLYGFVHCSADARWIPKPFECLPVAECGLRKHPAGMQLSWGGTEAGTSEFPWHVGVFRDGINLALCGGSLITPNFIISAAHCFESSDPAPYKIAAGKKFSDWNIQEAKEQRRSVKKINIPGSYEGNLKNLESDVAVVELASQMRITPEVSVVCSDWTLSLRHRHFARAGSVGIVPGWGTTENDIQSSTLRYVELPFVATDTCRQSVPADFRAFLTVDKFCGGFFNRSINVCRGDSGGGYVFANSKAGGRYFLHGVVSVSPFRIAKSCQIHFPTAFTSISAHGEWIREIVIGVETSDEE